MIARGVALALMISLPLPLWSIGFVYTGVGGGGRELMELTEVTVQVQIQDRLAVTRTDQVFTNRSGRVTEGIYEFKLPTGAIITDLVLWIDGRPVKGIIMEKEEGRQAYDAVVHRRVDPALIEQIDEETFRLSIFPFPQQGSRRVELEYMQVLEAGDGMINYTFPLASETDLRVWIKRFTLRAEVRAQHLFDVSVLGVPQQMVDTQQADEHSAQVAVSSEELVPEGNLHLAMREKGAQQRPVALSYPPSGAGEMGYYALWLPLFQELTQADPVPRSITFVIDRSSSMQRGRLTAVRGALATAVEDLESEDLFNVVVFSNQAQVFAQNPVEATAANKEEAIRFVNQQDALGVTNFEAAFAVALGQAFPRGRTNQAIFLTDGYATLGETESSRLSEMIADLTPADTRIFTIGVGSAIHRGFLRALADGYQGEAHFVADEGDIEETLRALFRKLARPVFVPTDLIFEGTLISDLFPQEMDLLTQGQEIFQVGRYETGGDLGLRLEGTVYDELVTLDFPLVLSQTDTSLSFIPRLWAYQKVQALEGMIDRYGTNQEILDDILDLGLTYRLVTRRTSLFAPDDDVVVNPETAEESSPNIAATAVEATEARIRWMGREFVQQSGVWVDVQFQQSMGVEPYEGKQGQPDVLMDFARLGQDMIVVVDGKGYKISGDFLPKEPVLSQNMPNPFNSSTVIGFQVPADMEMSGMRLAIHNLMGQLVRELPLGDLQLGENRVIWDGENSRGQAVASGIYIYRLAGDGFAVSRRMALLR